MDHTDACRVGVVCVGGGGEREENGGVLPRLGSRFDKYV
jgi:hypothetical protein